MNSFYKELSEKIIGGQGYTHASDELFKAYVHKMVGSEYEVNKDTIKKLSTSLQFFYLSGYDKYINEGASLLSMLLEVSGEEIDELVAIADNVFSQSGDFPNVKLLEEKFEGRNFKVNILGETLKDLREELNSIEEIDHPLTDYQRILWEDLVSDQDVITSAPTSTGKTHIILRYLILKLMESDGAFAAVVVPTRALISELAIKIYEIAKNEFPEKDIEICTVPKEGPFKERTIFVMTQERLHEILQPGDLYFNYLFVDEAHNISDKSRGALLHLTLQKLLEDSYPQIIISMPSYLYQNAFDSVFEDVEFVKKKTNHSPVAKIIMPVVLKGRQMLISRMNRDNKVSIEKGFTKRKLADIVYRLGKGESNIVYRNKTNHCENTANNIAELIHNDIDNPSLEEAADYVERFLHKDFTLASNLRKGVAFHYSPLPSVVRTMIEGLAREGHVKFIVCTSTLAEGVNLPAKNLFLYKPTQQTPIGEPDKRLENVKIDNITGRAGRMLEHFAGNIFLIDHHEWDFQDYFNERTEEVDKISTYFRILNEDLEGVLNALKGTYDHNADDQYTYYTVANKLLKEFDGDNLGSTMSAKELRINREERGVLENYIKDAYNELRVDTFTMEGNPTVGFIQQNKLYSSLLNKDDMEEWTLPHPKSSGLYDRLLAICNELKSAGIWLFKEAYTTEYACSIAKKWMCGETLKSMILRQIEEDKNNGYFTSCNSSVRNVIKVINNDVRFRMSNALRCYHSLLLGVLGEMDLDLVSMKIHSFIEVGGCEDRFINLVNLGLSRDTSLEVDKILPRGLEVGSVEFLRKLYKEERLTDLHTVSLREVANLLV